jgi:hypothetical protein
MTDDELIVDADVVDDDAPSTPPPASVEVEAPIPPPAFAPTGSTELITARGPADLVRRATRIANALDRVIKDRELRVNMGTRAKPRWHIEVEGWQTLGTLLGLATILRDGYPRPLGPPVRYRARVEHFVGRGDERRLDRITTYDVDGHSYEAVVDVFRGSTLIASARGRCDRTEARWARADEYAVASMAQTRATSRALKQAAGWIVALAGYESTPSAEVDPRAGSTGPAYGPPADDELLGKCKGAIGWLIGAGADEEGHEQIEDVLTKLQTASDGYLPHVVATAVRTIALDLRDRQTNAGDAGTTEG